MTALYIGGAHSGKTELAKRMHPNAPMLEKLHLRIYEAIQAGESIEELQLQALDKIVICDEVGCGIVPMDAFEQEWRDAVGALCCELAAQAELVVRVTAGLPQVIKGKYK